MNFLEKVTAGEDPLNLIRVKPIPAYLNQRAWKSQFDRVLGTAWRGRLNPGGKEVLEGIINLQSYLPKEFGGITSTGNITDYGAKPFSLKTNLSQADFPEIYKRVFEFIKNPELQDTFKQSKVSFKKLLSHEKEIMNQSKGFKNLLKDFEAHPGGCGKAAGGRILFSNGSPDGKITKCAQKGIRAFIDDIKKGNYSKATMNILKGGGNVIKNILNPMELLKLRNYFGPVALGFMAAYEGGVITDDVVRQGTPLNESLANNWLTKSFLPYTKDYAKAKNLLATGKVPSHMKKYVKDVITFNEVLKDTQGIENRVSSRLIDDTGYGMLDGTSMYTKEQQDKEEKAVEEKLKGITDYNWLSGSAKDLEYKSLQDEMAATRMAKPKSINIFGKDFQYSDGFSPIFGFDKLKDRNQTVAFDDYMSPVDTPKDFRPYTYKDAEYKDVEKLPAAERQKYENFFTEIGFLKPRKSLSELLWDRKTVGVDKFDNPINVDTTVYDELLKDYNKGQKQKEASQYPGYYGANEKFSEGGITALRSKYEYKK